MFYLKDASEFGVAALEYPWDMNHAILDELQNLKGRCERKSAEVRDNYEYGSRKRGGICVNDWQNSLREAHGNWRVNSDE